MIKKLFILLLLCLIFTGCGKVSEDSILKEISGKIKNSYMLYGELSILNNDNVYNYEVEVSYKKEDFYKVSLTNISNNHNQIILKNDEGVFVLTPSLNKSFKFQSDWPYNNSQIYLIDSLLNDIKNDKERKFKENDKSYEFVTNVNYPNNRNLVKQKISIDNEFNITEIKVVDSNDSIKMEFDIDKIDYSPTFNDDYFTIDFIMETFNELDVFDEVVLDDSIYPLFLPEGTKLANSEKLKLDNGERIIMTFDGEKPFLLVEETSNVNDEFTIIPTSGEPYMLMDTLGVMTSNSLSWTTGGIDFYLVSDVLNTDELVEIAQSISTVPTMK